jgi:short-subunit dehydrogenase
VVLASRRADLLEQVAAQITAAGGASLSVPTDVAVRADIDALVARATSEYGPVDILVNAAGRGWPGPYVKQDPDEIVEGVAINLESALLLTRAVLPGMRERRRGHIIAIASVAGHMAIEPLYSATKFGLRGFCLSLRRELRGSGVQVSVVSPGFIRTDMTRHLRGVPMPAPSALAHVIAELVHHPRRELVYPAWYRLAIWIDRALPGLTDIVIRPRKPRKRTTSTAPIATTPSE